VKKGIIRMANKHTEKRASLRVELWPNEVPFEIPKGTNGWFMTFRTIPLIMTLLREKSVSGGGNKGDVGNVYLELLSRHMGGGLVELDHEADHAFASGFSGQRSIRSWKERMRLLESMGFIKIDQVGGHFRRVMLVHPSIAVQQLFDDGKVPAEWWRAFRTRQLETTEPRYEDLVPARTKAEPILIQPDKRAKKVG
jgi:hypothetical protein